MGKRRVLLYGNSVIIGALGLSLRQSSRYEVLCLSISHENDLAELAPDVVLFDLEGCRPEAAFRMLETYPSLTLVGVSSDNNMVKVWSSSQLREPSTKDLLEVINSHPENVPAEIREGGADYRRND